MKDERGLYYFPNAADHRARMYVRRGEDGGVQFRLWQSSHPSMVPVSDEKFTPIL